ncbi:PLP-dependent aminotransferase family protein [Chitinophaga sp. Hz27]|uniref:aminotransferase-like domain-containing protein n=1 Tax=Chitinophaga sp. Hz27 TaxID=3347169 RepID=UPI0035D628CB
MQTLNEINPFLDNIGDDVMGFLNEVQLQYTDAISFASGRPEERHFGIENFSEYIAAFVDFMAAALHKKPHEIMQHLGQYNRAKGIINEQISAYLRTDENIHVTPEDITITVGSQEAMTLAVTTLVDREKDIIIVEDPTYVGLTHFSIIGGYQVSPVPVSEEGISLHVLEEKLIEHSKEGKKVKLVYVIPDFQNPTGTSMPLANRYKLLELAETYDFLILEDNAYGEFVYGRDPVPSIKALDKYKRVIYMRSFSKTLYPSLRLSAMVTDRSVVRNGVAVKLNDLLAKTKGYTTVNTSTLTQAILGGILIKNNCSLKEINREKVASMQQKRDQVLNALCSHINTEENSWAENISWNVPDGGFFATIKVPFAVCKTDVEKCAATFKVIFTPMSFFFLADGGNKEIRIAFSNLSPEQIHTGIGRLVDYFKYRLSN